MQRVWKIKTQHSSELKDQLLALRGINSNNTEAASAFLMPEYSKLHDPFLFKDMAKAAARIWQAIEAKEKIIIYSDYDADAITANAVVYRGLKALGADLDVYIPDRFSEGYGLNLEAFEKIKEQGAAVVITVDCGTNSTDEADFCAENGIDLIITDHHELTGAVPKSFALINPKLSGENYPYHELTGVGVAYKLICAVYSTKEKHNLPQELPDGYEKWLLDLVAIGTVADCHSLLGENRILVRYGLKVLSKTKWPGLSVMMQLAAINPAEVSTYTLGFVIAPRINAAGRIEHASLAFDLLVSEDPVEVLRLAQELDALNKRRQMLTENVMSEARAQLALVADRKVLLASGNDWPKGVVGLVAGKLVEEFAKPVLILEKGEELSTGSARSIANFNIVEALNFSKQYLVKYGGHAAAAGFTLKNEHVDLFYQNLLEFAETNLNKEDAVRVVEIDAELQAKDITMQTIELIEAFEPFGVDNIKPKFLLANATLENFNAVGKEQKHLQMTVSSGGKFFKCIAFNFGRSIDTMRPGQKKDLVFELIADVWNGTKNIKLRIIDMHEAANA